MPGQSWTVHNIGRRIIFSKPCFPGVYIWPMNATSSSGWGRPFADSEGTPINPPLGTPGGSNPLVRINKDELGALYLTRGQEAPIVGNVDWTNGTDTLTFFGPPSRSCPAMAYEFFSIEQAQRIGYSARLGDYFIAVNWSNSVFKGCKKIASTGDRSVLGAGIATFGETRVLIVVAMTDQTKDEVLYAVLDGDSLITDFLSAGELVYPTYTGADEFAPVSPLHRDHCFHFSASGLKAVTIYKEEVFHSTIGTVLKNSMLEISLSYTDGELSFTENYTHYLPHFYNTTGGGEVYNVPFSSQRIFNTTSAVAGFVSPDVVLAADYKGEDLKTLKFAFTAVTGSSAINGTSPLGETRSRTYAFNIVLDGVTVDTVSGYSNNTFLKPGTNTYKDNEVFIGHCDIRNDKLIWIKRETTKSSAADAENIFDLSNPNLYQFTAQVTYNIKSIVKIYDSGDETVLFDVTNGPYTSVDPTVTNINYLQFPEDPDPADVEDIVINDYWPFYNHLKWGSADYNDGRNELLTSFIYRGYAQTLDGILIANIHYQFNPFWFSDFMAPFANNISAFTTWTQIPQVTPKNYVYITDQDASEFLSVSGVNWGVSGLGFNFKPLKI